MHGQSLTGQNVLSNQPKARSIAILPAASLGVGSADGVDVGAGSADCAAALEVLDGATELAVGSVDTGQPSSALPSSPHGLEELIRAEENPAG
jgi:hypothetical protein